MKQSKRSELDKFVLFYENHDEYENISNMIRKAKLNLKKKISKKS